MTGPIPNESKANPVKWPTQSVCFNQWSIIKCTQNKLNKIANI